MIRWPAVRSRFSILCRRTRLHVTAPFGRLLATAKARARVPVTHAFAGINLPDLPDWVGGSVAAFLVGLGGFAILVKIDDAINDASNHAEWAKYLGMVLLILGLGAWGSTFWWFVVGF